MITPAATTLGLILLPLIPIIAAQTEANCTGSQYDWMFNSVGLSPCHVAMQLAQPCSPLGFNIPSLQGGQEYFGPSSTQNNTCICTSVYYSMLSACGACQNATWVPWGRFTTNCTTAWLTVYPNPIPPGVKVPHWAYLDVSIAGTFTLLGAENAGGPESTSPAGATSISSTSTPTSSSSSSSSPSSLAGPIAGGVVGGVIGLALIAGLIIFFCRRSGQHRSDQSRRLMSGPDVLSMSPPPPIAWKTSPLVPALRPQKLYDPQDPTTFPQNQSMHSPPLVPLSLTGTTYNTTGQDAHQPTPNATYYRGVPEVD